MNAVIINATDILLQDWPFQFSIHGLVFLCISLLLLYFPILLPKHGTLLAENWPLISAYLPTARKPAQIFLP